MDISGTEKAFAALQNISIYTETYGCTYNTGDTEKLVEIARARGCKVVDSPSDADAVLINTCIVIEKTEAHMYERLTMYENKMLFITGCLPPVAEARLRTQFPRAHIINPDLIHEYYCRAVCSQSTASQTAVAPKQAVLQIARGCNGHCTYCITRLARGKLHSFSKDEIIAQAKSLIAAGATELQVTAQDTASWGMDFDSSNKPPERLPNLLRELGGLEGNFMIRVGMANPDTLLPILDDYLDALKCEKIFLFLHIPVQSGADAVLKRMGRRYSAAQYEEIIARARAAFPDIRVCTDYIAGFSGETDLDAEESVLQIKRTRPGKVNITRFSVRPRTPAAKYPRLAEPIKKERSRALTDAANAVYEENGNAMLGRVFECVVTETDKKGSVTARDRSYQNIVIKQEYPLGTKLRVKIVENRRHYLVAEPVSED